MSKLRALLTRSKDQKQAAKANKLYKEATREKERLLVDKEREVESIEDKIEELELLEGVTTPDQIKTQLNEIYKNRLKLEIIKEELDLMEIVFEELFGEEGSDETE